ncbi:hypothetical protein RSAG8_09055, partial [Rhizoctonia solani AG-8 WAC10335]
MCQVSQSLAIITSRTSSSVFRGYTVNHYRPCCDSSANLGFSPGTPLVSLGLRRPQFL